MPPLMAPGKLVRGWVVASLCSSLVLHGREVGRGGGSGPEGSPVCRRLQLHGDPGPGPLREAAFHLIRLLYDEYMYYLIEHRVAQAKGEDPHRPSWARC